MGTKFRPSAWLQQPVDELYRGDQRQIACVLHIGMAYTSAGAAIGCSLFPGEGTGHLPVTSKSSAGAGPKFALPR